MRILISSIRYFLLIKGMVPGWRGIGITLLLYGFWTNVTWAQTKVWDKTFEGDKYDILYSLKQTNDEGYIIGGYSESGISGDKSGALRGSNDFWVVKLQEDGTKEWDTTLGGENSDGLISLQQTRDGGYILGGYSYSGQGGDKSEENKGHSDFWVVKLNAEGNKVWDKTLGGDHYDNLTSLQQTQDGGYILGGYSAFDISGDKSQANRGDRPDSHDYWVVKLNPNGSKEWDITFGGKEEEYLIALRQTQDGGYILGGGSTSGLSVNKSQPSKGTENYWVVKLNATGNKEWDKAFGGDNYDELESLQQTRDGGYILGGGSYSDRSGDKSEDSKGDNDYWVIKLDAKGSKVWDKTFGGDGYEILFSLQQTRDGNYILGGNSSSGINGDKTEPSHSKCDTYFCDTDYWIVKLNANGNKIWDKSFGGDNYDIFRSLQQTSDGGYILGGSSESSSNGDKTETVRGGTDYWIVKLEESTPPLQAWNMRYGGTGRDNFTTAIKTADGGYLSGGYTESGVSGDKTQSSQGEDDYWIVKSDRNGKREWDKRYGGTQDDYLNRVIQTQDGGCLLAGSSLSGKSGDKSEASQGERDFWLVKVDAQGNKEWDKTLGGTGLDEVVKIVQLASGEYVLGGYSNSPAGGDKTQPSQGGTDFWLVKISSSGTKLWDKRYGGVADESLGSFTETSDGGFFLGGSTVSGKGGDKS